MLRGLITDFEGHLLPPRDRARARAFMCQSQKRLPVHYARRLEQRLYCFHRKSREAYMAHMRKLTHSLASNGEALLGLYTPDQLARLTDFVHEYPLDAG